MKKLIVEANVENLYDVRDFVNKELERHNCPPAIQDNINLAVEEIYSNIANYAYQPASGSVAVFMTVGESAVIRFEDTGVPYNPLEHPEPDLDKPLMERKVGGLGIFLVKKVMDKVEYMRVDEKNALVLTKRLDQSTGVGNP